MILIIRYARLLGSVLADLRRAGEVTQAELGERAGVAGSMVSDYERSIVTPSLATAIQILDGLGWRLAALPATAAETHDARDLVVQAAREWREKGTYQFNGDSELALIKAVDHLVELEKLASMTNDANIAKLPQIPELKAQNEKLRERINELESAMSRAITALDV